MVLFRKYIYMLKISSRWGVCCSLEWGSLESWVGLGAHHTEMFWVGSLLWDGFGGLLDAFFEESKTLSISWLIPSLLDSERSHASIGPLASVEGKAGVNITEGEHVEGTEQAGISAVPH